jgi:hypothetical protein
LFFFSSLFLSFSAPTQVLPSAREVAEGEDHEEYARRGGLAGGGRCGFEGRKGRRWRLVVFSKKKSRRGALPRSSRCLFV